MAPPYSAWIETGTDAYSGRAQWTLSYDKNRDVYYIFSRYNGANVALFNERGGTHSGHMIGITVDAFVASNTKFQWKLINNGFGDNVYALYNVGSTCVMVSTPQDGHNWFSGIGIENYTNKTTSGIWWDGKWLFKVSPSVANDGTVQFLHLGTNQYMWNRLDVPQANILEMIGNAIWSIVTNPIKFGEGVFTSIIDSVSAIARGDLDFITNNIFMNPLMEQAVKILPVNTITQKVSDAIVGSLNNNLILQGGSAPQLAERRAEIINCIIIFILICISIMILIVCVGGGTRR